MIGRTISHDLILNKPGGGGHGRYVQSPGRKARPYGWTGRVEALQDRSCLRGFMSCGRVQVPFLSALATTWTDEAG